jgi:hypothetical protein
VKANFGLCINGQGLRLLNGIVMGSMLKEEINTVQVLLMKPHADDVGLVLEILQSTEYVCMIKTVSTLKEALLYLENTRATNSNKPDVVFVYSSQSINLEMEILDEICSNKDFLNIPVFRLTNTNNRIEITKAVVQDLEGPKQKTLEIDYIMSAIVSLKTFMGSLEKAKDVDNPQTNM